MKTIKKKTSDNYTPIMFVGTASDVGKSFIVTGICRYLKQKGFNPAPFKAQNISLNSYATPNHLEIGRAQAVQAEACKIPCHVNMNPVLIKPTNENTTQIILHGKPLEKKQVETYYSKEGRPLLFNEVKQAFNQLHHQYSPIIMEGSGSISELNLKQNDIANMQMAKHANAHVYLIADISRGGVFAHVYGTIALLEKWEKERIKGIIINKFSGDPKLFKEGKTILENLTGIPVLGIIPHDKSIYIEDEDSVTIDQKNKTWKDSKINIAIILLPHISNFTDFNYLEKDTRVNLYYTDVPTELGKADIMIIPGTKNTLGDLNFLRKQGLDSVLEKAFKQNKKIIGICGGYQMMGEQIKDPYHSESSLSELPGLGFLPIQTVLEKEKQTIQHVFQYKDYKEQCIAYEIHKGITTSHKPSPFVKLKDKNDGYWLNNNCWGTYLHGIFDNQIVIDDLLSSTPLHSKRSSYQAYKEENYNKLAKLVQDHIDMETICKHLFE